MTVGDPFAVLGLRADATSADVREAQRALAKLHHPDAGGDDDRMREINAAAESALRSLAAAATTNVEASVDGGAEETPAADRGGRAHRRPDASPTASQFSDVRRDTPSFVVEALPVEAFEGLLIVASWLGEVIDDDPPYRLDVRLDPIEGVLPADTWCRLELVPDAGAATVSLTVATALGAAPVDVDVVRDVWVHALNQLDWPDS